MTDVDSSSCKAIVRFAPQPDHIYNFDALQLLELLPDESVNCIVTSPPYFGLRDYGTGRWIGGDPDCDHAVRTAETREKMLQSSSLTGGKKTVGHAQEGYKDVCARCGARREDHQIGLEPTPAEYVASLVRVFREARRVLRRDGVCWLNLGDSYNNAGSARNGEGLDGIRRGGATGPAGELGYKKRDLRHSLQISGIKHKDLIGIPWMVAFALRADGWYLRSEIIWGKENPMPESVEDRPTKAHEQIFLLAKSPRYWYDAEAIREPMAESTKERDKHGFNGAFKGQFRGSPTEKRWQDGRPLETPHFYNAAGRNKRTIWMVNPAPFAAAHFATFPPALIEPMVLAGCPAGGLVLDPFMGAGTTAVVAHKLGRHYLGSELNPEYVELARMRVAGRLDEYLARQRGEAYSAYMFADEFTSQSDAQFEAVS